MRSRMNSYLANTKMRRFLLLLVWSTTIVGSTASISPKGLGFVEKKVQNLEKNQVALQRHEKQTLTPRGGAGATCDSNPILALKMGVSVVLETVALMGVIAGGKAVSPTVSSWLDKIGIPGSIAGLPVAQWISLVVVIFNSSFIAAFIEGGMSTATNQVLQPDVVPGDPSWYANLKRPSWEPPGWVFPIMWLIVSKPTQMIAVTKLLKNAAAATTSEDSVSSLPWTALAVYCEHLALGDAWNRVFFGCQRIGLGVAVITTFFGFLLWATRLFFNLDNAAGKFMLPTCAWVTIATALQWSIYLQNNKEPSQSGKKNQAGKSKRK